ncbi:DeoR/GlpR family DNA-binding transcription regulator [Pedobacter heparinus]|uniref:Regulatory protein DeoR n=1 Tax=Pedobacter heparinus (strain ATCC 13125 / DSM 2366 / CIP 104194 / JCM 7457 / NBRC 12017 / NCIMB 9290 / NRRL B-14731 / HIM 762-3) TaxID=485917 RepID=C6XX07_PEDHD|nr:DeoR/GlpR family DNA-binding transcription regulator [Pedobacter heparinus]ACU04301.1 regulatory protein DeoR [Pedobacter heparinus DSM 2366]
MRKEERHKLIMREINLHNKVLSTDLSVLLNISDDTVRRDLKELAETGKLLKVHGGAASKSFVAPFNAQHEIYALNEKNVIAKKTLKIIKNEMVILTEGGTTILQLARMIPENLKVTFFTISPQVAITLSDHSNLEVITIGGKLNKNANLHVGASVINQLVDLRADLCLLGANAFSAEEGLTDMDWDIVQVKKAIIRSSKKTAVLSISEKLNTAQRIRICGPDDIDYLITELPAGSPLMQGYTNDHLIVL